MTDIFSIKKLRNVFVTNNSVIIDKGLVVKDSCVREDNYLKYLKLRFRLKYLFPIFSCSRNSYILATDEWSKNYCHFFWEALSKLILLKKNSPEAILILPKAYLQIDFMMRSLEAFGFKIENIKSIPKKSQLRVKNLEFISCIKIGTPSYYDFLRFGEVSKTLISHYQDQLKTNFGARIYISRSDPKKNTMRKISNESELTKMLSKYGFKVVYMENFSFLDQMSIMSHARFIVAPHGAGITNVMFARQDCHLFEMVNIKWAKTCFAHMCEKMNLSYSRIDCSQKESGAIETSDIEVGVHILEEELLKFNLV